MEDDSFPTIIRVQGTGFAPTVTKTTRGGCGPRWSWRRLNRACKTTSYKPCNLTPDFVD